MTELLDQLNDKQKEAVTQTEGPVLVLAGAGSGKTRALTFRVAHLVRNKKVPPKNILAVTFTNKAAGEMLERVKELLGLPHSTPPFSQYMPHIGTFHSICVRILRKEIEKVGYEKSFVIYDPQDQLAVTRRVMKKMGVSTEQIKPQAVLGAISDAKNKLIDAVNFEQQMGSFFEEQVAKCFLEYQRELKIASALDFDDIIMLTVQIFKKYPEVLEKYQDIFKYIMVDEYQDTNHAQYTLLRMLAKKHKNICVVGDDWQSIYGWRGADVQNILDFEKDYPKAKVVLLEQNYRSTQNILDAAHQIISKNVNRKEKKLWTDNDEGNLLTLFEASDEQDEANFVVKQIVSLKKEQKLKLDDFAVLYRTNAQSRALEEAFMKIGMPYKIIGGFKFYERKEIKDILAYLLFVRNLSNKVSFERIINVPPRGLGEKTVGKIIAVADEREVNILEAIKTISLAEDHKEYGIAPSKIKTLKDFKLLMKNFRIASDTLPVSKLIAQIYKESGYEGMLLKEGEEGQVRTENIQELLTVAKKYDDQEDGMDLFLEEVALVSQTDRDLETDDAVPLMTLHSAKGLEYETVFIVGMEEGLLPHSRAVLNEKEMEEERRLCYVGITRAKKKAHLLYTSARTIYGSTQISIKSRFVDEIDNELFEESYSKNNDDGFFSDEYDNNRSGFGGRQKGFIKRPSDIQLSELDVLDQEKKTKKETKFRDGDKVKHVSFGQGIVVCQDKKTLSVAFAGVGLKKLAKGVAPIEKI